MGDTPPNWGSVLTAWTFSPVVDALLVVGAAGYGWLVHRRREPWPTIRVVCWYAGLVGLVVTLDSALARYAHHLFTAHMVVHLMMIMVVPALLVWAQPIRLGYDAMGARARSVVDRVRTRTPVRFLVSAWFTVPLYSAVIVLTHLTGFQQAMATHMWIHDAELLLYFLSGYLLLLPLAGGELTVEPPWPYSLRLLVLAVCMGPDTLVGVTLMMSSSVLAPAYAASRTWGPDALGDQSAAGVIMWVGGDGLMMLLMIIVAGQWIRSGDRSFGPWLDDVRRRATLGEFATDTTDIDDEQAALDAYNARLADLHSRDRPHHDGGRDTDPR
ncbi:cytochrome c oxidase assembly protein [Nocardia terpenica]|uniref:cytochrome c oxidase assembly protein n=1 Tax=Nocardia terpenica TaxID=455432 RepID=UPI00082A289D|nr:cytochrome c oxidase assembly protein [Nocardia terpenica]